MCGILAYILNSGKDGIKKEQFQDILDELNHRGPDAQGLFLEDKIMLGHKRLSIIDLSEAGNQPMCSIDGNYVIILNGEIYNYIEIRNKLLHDFNNLSFQSNSDTEILLLGYIKYGSKILELTNGMFSFIIYDKKKSEIFIARDRFGIKPLYYAKYKNNLIFCSEIKPILKIIQNYSPNKSIIFDYVSLDRVDHSDSTFFKEIRRFPAGHFLKINNKKPLDNNLKFIKWWNSNSEIKKFRISSKFKKRTINEHVKQIKNIIEHSIKLRLRSDVEVGSCLSGGLDSSSIVSIASKLLINTNSIFRTYSILYGEWFELDETKYVDNIVNSFQNVKGIKKSPSISDVIKNFNTFIYHQEEPVPSFSPYTQFEVMKLAKTNNQKVLLDGQGADEIFAGYDYMFGYYLAELIRGKKIKRFLIELFIQLKRMNFEAIKTLSYQFIPSFLKKKLLYKNIKYLSSSFFNDIIKENSIDFYKSKLYDNKDLNKALLSHIKNKLQHLLRWEDRNAMAFSIENRTPFLDHNLVVYVLATKSNLKINRGINKWALRHAMISDVPKMNLFRTDKIGFAAPDKYWINHKKNKFVKELISKPHPYLFKLFNLEKIQKKLNKKTKFNNNTNLIFKLICLNVWLKLFFNQKIQRIE